MLKLRGYDSTRASGAFRTSRVTGVSVEVVILFMEIKLSAISHSGGNTASH